MYLLNSTRYSTDDLARIIAATVETPVLGWHVKYYNPGDQPFVKGHPGPFVKYDRNADEGEWIKTLAIVRPQAMKGLDDLQKMACLTGMQAPERMVLELMGRIRAACEYHNSSKHTCSASDARSVFNWRGEEFRAKIKENGLTLRFREKEPSKEELASRDEEWQIALTVRHLAREHDNGIKSIGYYQMDIKRRAETIEAAIKHLENVKNSLKQEMEELPQKMETLQMHKESLREHQALMQSQGYEGGRTNVN